MECFGLLTKIFRVEGSRVHGVYRVFGADDSGLRI